MTTYGYFVIAIAFGALAMLAQWRQDTVRHEAPASNESSPINWWVVLKAFAAVVAFAALVAAVSSHVVSTSDY